MAICRNFHAFKQLTIFIVIVLSITSIEGSVHFLLGCKHHGGALVQKNGIGLSCSLEFPLSSYVEPMHFESICNQLFPVGLSLANPQYNDSKIICEYTVNPCTGYQVFADGDCYFERKLDKKKLFSKNMSEVACTKKKGILIDSKEFNERGLGLYFPKKMTKLAAQRTVVVCRRIKTEEEIRRLELFKFLKQTNEFHNKVYPLYLHDGTYRRLYVTAHRIRTYDIRDRRRTKIFETCHKIAKYYKLRGRPYNRIDHHFESFPRDIISFGSLIASYWHPGYGESIFADHYKMTDQFSLAGMTRLVAINFPTDRNEKFYFSSIRGNRELPLLCEFFDEEQDKTAKCPTGTVEWKRANIPEYLHPKMCVKLVPLFHIPGNRNRSNNTENAVQSQGNNTENAVQNRTNNTENSVQNNSNTAESVVQDYSSTNEKVKYYRDLCFKRRMTIIAPNRKEEMEEISKLVSNDSIIAVDGLLDVRCYDSEESEDCQFEVNDPSTNEELFRQYLSDNWGDEQPNLEPYNVAGHDVEYKRDCLVIKNEKFYTESCYPDVERRKVTHVLCATEPLIVKTTA